MKYNHKIKCSILASILSTSLMASVDVQQSVVNMQIENEGIYRLEYADVLALGIDLSGVNIASIAITKGGQNIPVRIISQDQVTFGPGAYIDFVGIPDESLYQKGSNYSLVLTENVLIQDSTVQAINQDPVPFYWHQTAYNDNNDYSFGAPNNDPWFAKRLLAIGSEVTETLNFDLNHLVSGELINIEMDIWGGTDYLQSPDHHVIYELNGQLLDDFRFDGITSDVRSYQLQSDRLVSGTQQLNIRVPNDTNTIADVIHVESMTVTYPRAFHLIGQALNFDTFEATSNNLNADVIFTDGFELSSQFYQVSNANNDSYVIYHQKADGSVVSVDSVHSPDCQVINSESCSLSFSTESTSGRLYISSEAALSSPQLSLPVILQDIKEGNAEYLIISHPDFIGDELDKFVQQKQTEYSVKVVDVEQIYAQFGAGNVSAQSIGDYIKYASSQLGTVHVLLIGGDTYDYKNYLGLGSVSFIPTLYGQTDDLITFAPIDAGYTDLDNDNIPDINIGRFPVRTEAELTNLINKLTAYTNKNYAKTAVFAADKFDVSNAYSFRNDAQFLIDLLPVEWQGNINTGHKAFIDDDGLALAKAKISDNINQGVALTSFIGHSGPRDWSFSRLFSATDANALTNADRPTLVTQWGCWNTYFVSPNEDTLAHAFMLNQNGGAASVLGASTLTKAEHERGLAQLVLTFLTHDELTLGDAVTRAKRVYAETNPDALDVILGWTILGDPSLRL